MVKVGFLLGSVSTDDIYKAPPLPLNALLLLIVLVEIVYVP